MPHQGKLWVSPRVDIALATFDCLIQHLPTFWELWAIFFPGWSVPIAVYLLHLEGLGFFVVVVCGGGVGFFFLFHCTALRSVAQYVKIPVLILLWRLGLETPQDFVGTKVWHGWVPWPVKLLSGQGGSNAPGALLGSIALNEVTVVPLNLLSWQCGDSWVWII